MFISQGLRTHKLLVPIGLLIIASLWMSSCTQEKAPFTLSKEDKEAIEKAARDLPLILSNQGWDAYEQNFTEDYLNWSMVRDAVRTREEFLALVKDWYDQGNRANGSTLKTIDFVPLSENNVMYLYALQERFNNPSDSSKTRIRDIRFIGIFRKEDGIWKRAFSAFMDLPEEG